MTADPVDVLWELEEPEDEELVEAVKRVSEQLRRSVGAEGRDLCVAIMDDHAIQLLNEQWRQEPKPTDVLSFPADADGPEGAPIPLGDIAISLETCARQATAHGWSLVEEVTFLVVHSVCHLMGHDHGAPEEAAAMRAEEDRLLAIVAPGQRRPPTPY